MHYAALPGERIGNLSQLIMLEGFTMVAGVLYCERHMVFPLLCMVWINHDSST